jgi:hypothetical protein
VLQLQITPNFVLTTLKVVTLIFEAIRSCETLIIARATRHHIPEDSILLLLLLLAPFAQIARVLQVEKHRIELVAYQL